MKSEYTSKSVAAKAAAILRDPRASKSAKSVAASALTQVRDRPRRVTHPCRSNTKKRPK